MYAIAVRFSEDARRAAVEAVYDRIEFYGQLRTAGNECPIGVCLNHDRIPHPRLLANHPQWCDPDSVDVALALAGRNDSFDSVNRDALDFIKDWDRDQIADLAEALGV